MNKAEKQKIREELIEQISYYCGPNTTWLDNMPTTELRKELAYRKREKEEKDSYDDGRCQSCGSKRSNCIC